MGPVPEGTPLATDYGPAVAGKFYGHEDTNQQVVYDDPAATGASWGAFHWRVVHGWAERAAQKGSS